MQWHSTFKIMLALTCCSKSTMNAAQNRHAFSFHYQSRGFVDFWELVLLHLHPANGLWSLILSFQVLDEKARMYLSSMRRPISIILEARSFPFNIFVHIYSTTKYFQDWSV